MAVSDLGISRLLAVIVVPAALVVILVIPPRLSLKSTPAGKALGEVLSRSWGEIFTNLRLRFPLKASVPMEVTVEGMVSSVSLLSAKAWFPMEVVSGGMRIAVNSLLANLDAGTAVTVEDSSRVLLMTLPVPLLSLTRVILEPSASVVSVLTHRVITLAP